VRCFAVAPENRWLEMSMGSRAVWHVDNQKTKEAPARKEKPETYSGGGRSKYLRRRRSQQGRTTHDVQSKGTLGFVSLQGVCGRKDSGLIGVLPVKTSHMSQTCLPRVLSLTRTLRTCFFKEVIRHFSFFFPSS
jgi:hypothetical protein